MPLRRLFHGNKLFCPWKKLCRVIFAAAMLAIAVLIALTTFLHLSKFITALKSTQTGIQAESWDEHSLNEPPELRCHSFCPSDEHLNSSKVTKLGNYPQTKRFLSIGIASVARPSGESYLLQTVQSLTDNMSDMDKKDTYIVIFLADLLEQPKSTAKAGISTAFGKYIDQGLLIVIETYPDYYPPLTNIKKKYGDSDNRRTWRSKENLDAAFLMCYCKHLSQYYIHLEDDMISSRSFFPKLQDFVIKKQSEETAWAMLDASLYGSKAKVCHSEDLENLASYFYLMFDEMPIDWLMTSWREVKDGYARKLMFLPASLFQHIGKISSLEENPAPKNGSDKEPFFDQFEQKYKGLNPPATVTSSLSSYQGKPQDAYEKGAGYFWGKYPRKGDHILIKFNTPTNVQEVFVDTGSYDAWGDTLKSGILQASFESAESNRQIQTNTSCGDFETLESFKSGKAKIFSDKLKKMVCLRIEVTLDQNEWLYLREIDVW